MDSVSLIKSHAFSLTAAILRAFDESGGVDYLKRVADEHPQVFCALLGKVLPTQICDPADEPVSISVITGVPREPDGAPVDV
jgi:hypothetical protein